HPATELIARFQGSTRTPDGSFGTTEAHIGCCLRPGVHETPVRRIEDILHARLGDHFIISRPESTWCGFRICQRIAEGAYRVAGSGQEIATTGSCDHPVQTREPEPERTTCRHEDWLPTFPGERQPQAAVLIGKCDLRPLGQARRRTRHGLLLADS